jgi:hypothetical protein
MIKAHQEALKKAQDCFSKANFHPSQQEFREKIFNDYGFYDGTNQWDLKDLLKLQEREQRPITVNFCKGFVDNLSGVEIQSRYRAAVRSDSLNEKDDKLAEALTHLMFYIQESQEIPYKDSLKFRDQLICGIGWSYSYQENNVTYYDYVHPFNVIPDPDDLSPQFTKMQYVCRKFWLTPAYTKKRWEKALKDVDLTDNLSSGYYESFSPEILDRNTNYTDKAFYKPNQSRILVVEVQYKEPHKFYIGIDKEGRSFETFNIDTAEKIAEKKSDIEEQTGERIMRVLFCNDTLLEFAPLKFSLPNQQDFSYIPIVFQRRFSSGVPYGMLEALKDIQRDCNARITKSIHNLNSKQIIFEGSLPSTDIDRLKNELVKGDGVLVLPQDSKFQVNSNANLSDKQIEIVNLYLDLAQRAVGVTNEQMGLQTNATSAISQHVRQVNSVRNNVFAFDNFASMKKRAAKLILNMIQASGITNLGVEILDDEQREVFILNLVKDIDGKQQVFNDIRTLPISLYVEEVPDYASSFAEEEAKFQSLLTNGSAPWLMTSPQLLKRVGIRGGAKKMSDEIRAALTQQQAMQNPEQNTAQMMPEQPLHEQSIPVDKLSALMKTERPI